MPRTKTILFMLLFFGAMLTMSACGPRATGGATMAMAGDDRVAVDLPAIVIDYDTEGAPSMGGTSLGLLATSLGFDSGALKQLQLPKATISALTNANIQHIQIDNSVNGFVFLINGEPIPSLVWSEDSLVATAEVMDLFGYGISLLDQVLPTIQTLGIGAIIRFPVTADADIIPTVVNGDKTAASDVATAQQAFAETVGTPAQIQVVVEYTEDGSWRVAGLSPEQWSQAVPAPWEALNLPPVLMDELTKAGIKNVGFATNEDGFFVSVNEKTLPYIGWNQGELQHLLTVADQLGLLESAVGGIANGGGLMALLEEWLPVLQMVNLRLSVNFP